MANQSLPELLAQAQALNKEKNFTATYGLLTLEVLEQQDNAALYAEAAQACWRLKKYDDCENYADKALSNEPDNEQANYYKGGIFYKAKNYPKAIEYFQKAIDKDPNSAFPYNGLGSVYYNLEDYPKAIEYLQKAIHKDPNYAFPYNGLGNVYHDLKSYPKAIEHFKKAIDKDPNNAYPYNGLGNVYTRLGDYLKAIEYFQKAIDTDPNGALPYNGLGNVYNELKDYPKAIEFYQEAINKDTNYAFPYNGLGNVYYNLEDYPKAIEHYQKVLEKDPNSALPYNGLGNVYDALKDYPKAIEHYQQAIDKNPNNDAAYYNIGRFYYFQLDYKNALNSYNHKIELTKNNPDYYTEIAQDRVEEIKKILANDIYRQVTNITTQVKDLLRFNQSFITHYTSLTTARLLILEGSLFRLSEGAFLNDTSEGKELFKYLNFPQLPLQNQSDTIATSFTQKPFIGSFVADGKHDDLTLWRMYGKEGKEEAQGCAITFNLQTTLDALVKKLTEDGSSGSTISKDDNDFQFYKVAYRNPTEKEFEIPGATQEEKDSLNDLMHQINEKVIAFGEKKISNPNDEKLATDEQDLIEKLNEIAYLFKSIEYQYENEVRLVVKGVGLKKQVNKESQPPRVFVEMIDIRPFIQQITIGPKVSNKEEWASAFHYSLQNHYETQKITTPLPKILISHLPFK